MATYLTADFTLEEFQKASGGPLNAVAQANARRFAVRIYQPARTALGFPIKITSFYRPGDKGAHGLAQAVDAQPCRDCPELRANPGLFAERLEALFQWIAQNRAAEFGQLIHERNHVHTSAQGYAGQVGEVLREPTEGNYVSVAIEALKPVAIALAPVLIALLVSLLIMEAVD